MNHPILRNALQLAGAALIFCGAAAYAQIPVTPYLSNEGIAKAEQIAKDSLKASDLVLTVLLSGDPSMMDTSGTGQIPFTLEKFDMETGKASVWVYNYYSPSAKKSASAAVVKLPLVGFQGFGGVQEPDSADQPPTIALDLSGAYATSDKFVQRLKTNADYQHYHMQNPSQGPSVVMLSMLAEDVAPMLPQGFPLNQPIWTATFGDPSGESVMICYVASKEGTTFCQTAGIPSGVPMDDAARRATMTATPNPSNGRTRVDVALPSGVRTLNDVSVELYDATGRKVMDLTESFTASGLQYAEFDAAPLAAGVYYCRAAGADWVGMTGVIVQK